MNLITPHLKYLKTIIPELGSWILKLVQTNCYYSDMRVSITNVKNIAERSMMA